MGLLNLCLEGDCVIDGVPRSRLLTPLRFSLKKLNFARKVANWIIVDIIKYLYQPNVTGKLLASHFH